VAKFGVSHDQQGNVDLHFEREIAHLKMSNGDALDVACEIGAHAGAVRVRMEFEDGRPPVDCKITNGPGGTKAHAMPKSGP